MCSGKQGVRPEVWRGEARGTEGLKRVGLRVDTRSSFSLYFKTLTHDILDRHTHGEKWGRSGEGSKKALVLMRRRRELLIKFRLA